MRRKVVSWMVLLTASALFAQDSPLPSQNAVSPARETQLPKYRVVQNWPPSQAAPSVSEAAEQGYRLLFSSKLAIMRLDATPPDTFRYLPLPDERLRSTFLNALNQQGAFGYGWRKDEGILEKEPHPHNYEYRFVEGFKPKTRESSNESLLSQGFSLVGSFGNEPVFMRDIDGEQPAQQPRPARILNAMREGRLMREITELASRGYRYRSREISNKGGGKAVSMEECDATCGGPFEYRSFGTKDVAQLEHDLNALGREGFHVVPRSLDWEPHLVERPAKARQQFSYRIAEASEVAATDKFVNAGDLDGYAPIAFASHAGWSVHFYLILEKASAEE